MAPRSSPQAGRQFGARSEPRKSAVDDREGFLAGCDVGGDVRAAELLGGRSKAVEHCRALSR